MKRRLGVLAVASAAFLFSQARAHETWLLPDLSHMQVGESLSLDLTSGMGFPKPDTGPKPERIAAVAARIDDEALPLTVEGPAAGSLRLKLNGARGGLAVVSAVLLPRDIEIEPAELAEYFEEAAPSATVLAAWEAMPSPRRWRETYVKNAKALVCIGDCRGGRTAMRPTGAGLEFVALDAGPQPTRFRLLAAGEPLAGQQVEVIDSYGLKTRLRTDRGGGLTSPHDAKGRVMLSAVLIRPPATPGARFTSDFASITWDAGR